MQKAVFAAGCFWGTQKYFTKQFPQIRNAAVGYLGGTTIDPNYKDVCTGTTKHAEVFYFEYPEDKVKYEDLVEYFFRFHDPTQLNRQGNDVGTQYRSAIYYYTQEQKTIAEKVKADLQKTRFSKPITTTIEPAEGHKFYKAEDYHQEYLDKNPGGYCNHFLRW